MFCHNCGAKVEPDGRFCIQCGTPLIQADPVTEPQPPATATPSYITYFPQAVPPLTPPPPPPKKKLHWIWKDRIARVVVTVLVMVVLIPMINQCQAGDPIENPAAQKILTAVYPYTNTTYEQALNENFQKPKWKLMEPNSNGDICVEFTGKNEKDENVVIQLSWDKEDGGVYCNWIELEGKELSTSLDEMGMTPEEMQVFSAIKPKQLQSFLYQGMLFELFEPYFLPEQKEQAYGEQEALLMEIGFAALPGLFDSDAFEEAMKEMEEANRIAEELLDDIKEIQNGIVSDTDENVSSQPERQADASNASSAVETPAVVEVLDLSLPDYPGYCAIDLIGYNLGEIIERFGTDFVIPEYGYNGSSYISYEAIGLPYLFLFNPQYGTPSDEDLVVGVMVSNEGWITPECHASITLAQLEQHFPLIFSGYYDPDFAGAYIGSLDMGAYLVSFSWEPGVEHPTGAAQWITVIPS